MQFSLNALHENVMALTVGETEEEESSCSHPSTVSQGDPGRVVSCVARKVVSFLSLTFSAMTVPTWAEDTKQNLSNSREGSEIPFFHYI